MTIEEIKQKYGDVSNDYYINCLACPLDGKGKCPNRCSGYEDTWKLIQKELGYEHDGCLYCKYFDGEAEDEPCVSCKGTALVGSAAYETRPDNYEPTAEVEPVEPEPTVDMVNHPPHYTSGGIECIDELEIVFGREAVKHFCLCNVWKYRKRALLKNGQEDLDKADWYMAKYKELEDKDNGFHNKLP